MPRLLKPCARCPEPVPMGTTLCRSCATEADRDRRPDGNPYTTPGHQRFREAVLTRDPVCVICLSAPATIADHYPIERVDLVGMGADPDEPSRGRGLCKRCHDKHTAKSKPSGWNAPRL